ncbi:MAG: hypothetical protein PF448_10820 [Bacteroidales bacterium]|jgi:hypothetical protein|nr:hypothetical protein [Bacteroidales bacterium]
MQHNKLTVIISLLIILSIQGFSQGVAINTDGSNADGSAMLDVKANDKGVLIPRVNIADLSTAAPVTTPAEGLLVYNINATTGEGFYYWNSSEWTRLTINNDERPPKWSGTSLTSSDIGRTGNVGIGTTSPQSQLHITEDMQLGTDGVNRNNLMTFWAENNYEANILMRETPDHGMGIRYNATDNNLYFDRYPNTTVPSPIMTIMRDNERIGIGTTTPQTMFHVDGSVRFSNLGAGIQTTGLMIDASGNLSSRSLNIANWDNAYSWGDHATEGYLTTETDPTWNGTANQTSNIGRTGNVGIGTTSPLLPLDIRGDIVLGSGFTPTAITDDNLLNIIVGTNASGATNGISFYENTSGFGMKLGYDGTGSGATNKMAIYSDSDTELVTFENGGEIGIGVTAPNNDLDVNGNAQISEYLLVGNPSSPQAVSSTFTEFYSTGDEAFSGWEFENHCGTSFWDVVYPGSAADNVYAIFDNQGSSSRAHIYSPWLWIPTGTTDLAVGLHHNNSLESGWDGSFIEYSTNGTSWTKITSWAMGDYNANPYGSNTSCNGTDRQEGWSNSGYSLSISNGLSIDGTWVRFRIVGFEDVSVNSGECRVYRFFVEGNAPSFGGTSFQNGNIYAENNIYAGSDVLLGDIAEFFEVSGSSKPGYLISINPKQKDAYFVSSKPYDNNLIGIHSTNPTLTINDPSSGEPVALTGRVPVLVTGENGPIKPGDFITSSSTYGYGMKADNQGFVIAKALEHFDGIGKKRILCLIQPGYYNPSNSLNLSSGNFIIQKGMKEITVFDNSIQSKSKIFISLLGDPGSRHWVSEKENGAFTINFANPVTDNTPFDFLIENSAIIQKQKNQNQTVINKQNFEANHNRDLSEWEYCEQKGVYWKKEKNTKNTSNLPLLLGTSIPAAPEIKENVYIFTESMGLKMIKNFSKNQDEDTTLKNNQKNAPKE